MAKVDASFVYAACKRNDIKHSRIGKSYKFRKKDVLQWLTNQRHGTENSVDDYVNRYLPKHLLKR
ncbi:MAG: helix-turn-helix domain-containing protein [Bacteroidota bacterium]